jgi:hypothetical protein
VIEAYSNHLGMKFPAHARMLTALYSRNQPGSRLFAIDPIRLCPRRAQRSSQPQKVPSKANRPAGPAWAGTAAELLTVLANPVVAEGATVLAALSFSSPAVTVTGMYVYDGMVLDTTLMNPWLMVAAQAVGVRLWVLQPKVTGPVFGILMAMP